VTEKTDLSGEISPHPHIAAMPPESGRFEREQARRGEQHPCCECGYCHGPDVRLPMSAWAVAGEGDLDRIAVHSDHVHHFDGSGYTVEQHTGWASIG